MSTGFLPVGPDRSLLFRNDISLRPYGGARFDALWRKLPRNRAGADYTQNGHKDQEQPVSFYRPGIVLPRVVRSPGPRQALLEDTGIAGHSISRGQDPPSPFIYEI
jgi:hypothetical protein